MPTEKIGAGYGKRERERERETEGEKSDKGKVARASNEHTVGI